MEMIQLRKLTLEDLETYQYWKLPIHKYHLLNGPYFEKASPESIETEIKNLKQDLLQNPNTLYKKRIISNDSNELIGEVSWYWKSQETLWMEIGIVIFDEKYWGKGIGYQALSLWIDHLFQEKKDVIRLGLTTWSGNHGMLKLAEKIGMQKEAVYRKARIVEGEYFDSVSYGILKEEWEAI